MITLNLDLPYRLKAEEKARWPEGKHVSENLIRTLVSLRYQQGMNGTDTRIWAKVMDGMDTATADSGPPTMEIENSEFLWLRDAVAWCLEHSKIPPLMASWVETLREHIEELKQPPKPSKKTAPEAKAGEKQS